MAVDGEVLARLTSRSTMALDVPPGRHKLVVNNGRSQSNALLFDVEQGAEVRVQVSAPEGRTTAHGLLARFAPVVRWERVTPGVRVISEG